jgi:TIR domain
MRHIFVSYSRKDKEATQRLADVFEAAGYTVWTDTEIPGGTKWGKQIVEAIRAAAAFVVVLSSNSITSDQVRKELDIADGQQIPILPVVIEAVTLPPEMEYPLAGIQRIDLTAGSEAGKTLLLNALRLSHDLMEHRKPSTTGRLVSAEDQTNLDSILNDSGLSTAEKINRFVQMAGPAMAKQRRARDQELARMYPSMDERERQLLQSEEDMAIYDAMLKESQRTVDKYDRLLAGIVNRIREKKGE